MAGEDAYRDAGVDLSAALEAVAMIRGLAEDSGRADVVSGVGGFAGLVRLGDGTLLAAATDGAGTKCEIARLTGRLGTIGIDLVAMSVNDVVCTGAAPLFFLDYIAVGKLVPEEIQTIVSGVAEGCRRARCTLLGGETAEHPGTMESGQFDLAGFCVGIVDEGSVLDPTGVRAGDLLVGFRSSGLHSNGYSLVRRVLLEAGGRSLQEFVPELGRTLADELLEPTLIYAEPLLALGRGGLVRSAAHITGGGIEENLPRALPEGLGATIDTAAWTPQPIFALVAEAAGASSEDLRGVLNMGMGMVAIVPQGKEEKALERAKEEGADALVIGRVEDGTGIQFV
jgi:phosphoribosylformylglycinamidine cyclo-ligase